MSVPSAHSRSTSQLNIQISERKNQSAVSQHPVSWRSADGLDRAKSVAGLIAAQAIVSCLAFGSHKDIQAGLTDRLVTDDNRESMEKLVILLSGIGLGLIHSTVDTGCKTLLHKMGVQDLVADPKNANFAYAMSWVNDLAFIGSFSLRNTEATELEVSYYASAIFGGFAKTLSIGLGVAACLPDTGRNILLKDFDLGLDKIRELTICKMFGGLFFNMGGIMVSSLGAWKLDTNAKGSVETLAKRVGEKGMAALGTVGRLGSWLEIPRILRYGFRKAAAPKAEVPAHKEVPVSDRKHEIEVVIRNDQTPPKANLDHPGQPDFSNSLSHIETRTPDSSRRNSTSVSLVAEPDRKHVPTQQAWSDKLGGHKEKPSVASVEPVNDAVTPSATLKHRRNKTTSARPLAQSGTGVRDTKREHVPPTPIPFRDPAIRQEKLPVVEEGSASGELNTVIIHSPRKEVDEPKVVNVHRSPPPKK